MSLKTFIIEVEDDVVNIFHSVEGELKTVIIPIAITVTNALKTVVVADSTDILGGLFGAAGAAVEDELRAILPGVVTKLQLAQQFLGLTDPNEIIAAAVNFANSLTSDIKAKFWIDFSGQVALDFAANKGIKLTIAQAIDLVQSVYAEINTPAATPVAPLPPVIAEGKANAEGAQ